MQRAGGRHSPEVEVEVAGGGLLDGDRQAAADLGREANPGIAGAVGSAARQIDAGIFELLGLEGEFFGWQRRGARFEERRGFIPAAVEAFSRQIVEGRGRGSGARRRDGGRDQGSAEQQHAAPTTSFSTTFLHPRSPMICQRSPARQGWRRSIPRASGANRPSPAGSRHLPPAERRPRCHSPVAARCSPWPCARRCSPGPRRRSPARRAAITSPLRRALTPTRAPPAPRCARSPT